MEEGDASQEALFSEAPLSKWRWGSSEFCMQSSMVSMNSLRLGPSFRVGTMLENVSEHTDLTCSNVWAMEQRTGHVTNGRGRQVGSAMATREKCAAATRGSPMRGRRSFRVEHHKTLCGEAGVDYKHHISYYNRQAVITLAPAAWASAFR